MLKKLHIEYDDFGEYMESMEDLLFFDRLWSEREGTEKTQKIISIREKWEKQVSGKGA